jgi:hypothetical protein
MHSLVDEYVELPTTDEDAAALLDILVRACGCGCCTVDGELVSSIANCSAVAMLRDRRFVLGLLFARSLRQQLLREKRQRRC